jgi:hypothetical protein
MFLKTSGTTGPAKLLPVTASSEAEADRGRRLWIERMIAEDERNASGCHLAVISPSHEGLTAGGIPYGSNTGRIFLRQPSLVRAFAPVPYPVFGLKDFSLRYYLILRFAMARADVGTFTTANPSTVLLLARGMLQWGEEIADDVEAGRVCGGERAAGLSGADFGELVDRAASQAQLGRACRRDPKRARQIRAALVGGDEGLFARLWPKLTTVNAWLGGHAPFYTAKLAPFLSREDNPIPIRDPGFSASEGLFGIPLGSGSAEGVLHVLGPFMEFVPEGEDVHGPTVLAHELEVGGRYQILVTTSGGLWRYDMRDVVEAVGTVGATPTVRFLYKAGGILSVTGEKVTEEHAVAVATALGCEMVVENVCASVLLSDPPRYLVAVEAAEAGSLDPDRVALSWDSAMSRANVEYEEKRASGRLSLPRVRFVATGAFEALRQRRVAAGAPDGQVKQSPLMRDPRAMCRALGLNWED